MLFQDIWYLIGAFVIAMAISYFVTPLVIIIAKRYKLVDDPATRYHPAHTHTGVIPRAGGLALYIGILLAGFVFLPSTKLYFGMAIAAGLLVYMGLMDDRKDVSPYIRLGTNALAAMIVVLAGAGIPYITNPLNGGTIMLDTVRLTLPFLPNHSILLWADILSFIWIMWTMNIIGWSAGVDGQMPGFVSISAFVLGLLSLRYAFGDPSQLHVTILAFIISGAFAGFTPWNFYPQKIMPGYGGKTIAGFFLAILGILSYAKFGTALLVLGVPMTDAVWTLLRRIGKKSSPVLADRKHLHHELLSIGWGRRRIALFYWSLSAILGAIALTVTSSLKVFALLVLGVSLGGFLVWINYFSQFSKPADPDNG
jgi:UDP-GlcNAc:undecaprenyl-phosphate GlcNAc-1-phosphate transferase